MLQVIPVFVYFVASKLTAPELLGELLPKPLVAWLPALLAVMSFVLMSQLQQAQAGKASAALVGKEAPDMQLDFKKDGKKMLRALVEETKLPTLVDFYQNFWPACGPAAQQIDKLAADPKYTGKVNFVLCNMQSLEDAEKFAQQKGLKGSALHGAGQPPKDYGIVYIPHKVLINKEGKVVKNFDVKLPADLDALLEG